MPSDPVVVTGAAGFIGSHVVDSLLAEGRQVRGIDCFTEFYAPETKRSNLSSVWDDPRFDLIKADLASSEELSSLLDAPQVIHLAAEAGVRSSWGNGFERYVTRNVLATQRVLEACRVTSPDCVVVASSSSVYGDAETFPTPEDTRLLPRSPYGITKLATENLASTYAANWGVRTVSLRFFTVFGPRQRPDMAFHRLIEAALHGHSFPLFGTGEQIRDFTFVGDVVRAILAAGSADLTPGSVFNVSGGVEVSLNEVVSEIENITGQPIQLDRQPPQAGDATRTGGSTNLASSALGWSPEIPLRTGLERQVRWHENRSGGPADNRGWRSPRPDSSAVR